MSHYNCRQTETPGTYLFTKFDEDLNIVDDSVYLTSESECTCPAGSRATCRHRQMLPIFLAYDRIDTGWFYQFETSSWSEPFESLDDGVLSNDLSNNMQQALEEDGKKLLALTGENHGQMTIEEAIDSATAPTDEAPSVRELHDSELPIMRSDFKTEGVTTGRLPSPKTFRRL